MENVNEVISAVVADTVTAVSSTSLSSVREGKSETLTITDTDQQTVQEKTHPRISAFPGLFILMVATFVAFVAFMLERLRAVEARLSSISVSQENSKKLYKKAEKQSKSAINLLALKGSKQVETIHAAINIAANKQLYGKQADIQHLFRSAYFLFSGEIAHTTH